MNEIKALQSMGFVLPSPAYIFGAVLFGLLGMAAFRRGKKTSQPFLTWTGVVLMLYPYAVSETWLLWGLGVGLSALAFTKWN
ncbi:MAG: hypothetical protein ABIZ09_19485 [Rhodoferax sp.]|jgi:hypothetical protein